MVRQALLGAGGIALGGLIALRLGDGTAGYLVQSWYEPILMASALVLVVLAAISGAPVLRSGAWAATRVTPGGLLTGVLVAAPILAGLVMKPEPLGAGNLSIGDSARQFSASAALANAGERNLYQWAYAFETEDPASLTGADIEVVGFVYQPEAAAGRFMVARFVVACCVADAQGFTLPVQWKDAGNLANDQWVRIEGRIGITPEGTPIVQATLIELIEAPSNPYIYP